MADAPPPAPPLRDRLVIKQTEFEMKFESVILKAKPYVLYRWISFAVLAVIFVLRMILQARFYTAAYVGGLYLLNCLVLFVSPKLDPDLYGADVLPTTGDGDYRPFVRRLPEFVFWRRAIQCILIVHASTLFRFLDPPVYGPMLLVYFLIVALLNFRTRIVHMLKHGYVPFDFGKRKQKKDAQ
jgi:hypothetical protein